MGLIGVGVSENHSHIQSDMPGCIHISLSFPGQSLGETRESRVSYKTGECLEMSFILKKITF